MAKDRVRIDDVDLLVLIDLSNYYDNVTPYYQDLALDLDIDKTTVYSRVQKLVKKGCIETIGKNTSKKQTVTHVITEFGRKCIDAYEILTPQKARGDVIERT